MKPAKILISTIFLFAFLSCGKEDKKLTIAKQEEQIEAYITRNFADYPVVRRNGSNRIIIESAAVSVTDSLEYGDTLHIYYAGYIFTSAPSSLFATNVQSVAEQGGFNTTNPDYSVKKLIYKKNSLIPGLENGLWGVREKEHCIILFSAQHGFYDDAVYCIPPLSALAFEIWIDRLKKHN